MKLVVVLLADLIRSVVEVQITIATVVLEKTDLPSDLDTDQTGHQHRTGQIQRFSSVCASGFQLLHIRMTGGVLILLSHPSFSWTRNGTHFDVEKDSKVLMKPGSGTLVIDISGEKAEAYEGTYQCTAHNDHGTAVSNKIVIRQSSRNSKNGSLMQTRCTIGLMRRLSLPIL